MQQLADTAREEEAARIKEEQEPRCKNVKNKCVDKPCQEKANKRTLPRIESKKDLQNKP